MLTNKTEYQRIENDWIIHTKKIHVYYSELPSEIRYQITEVTTYLSYKVVAENGEILVNMENDVDFSDSLQDIIGQYPVPVNISMTIVPNPVHSNFTVHFSYPIDAVMNVKIIDVMGNKYLDVPKYVGGIIIASREVRTAWQSRNKYLFTTKKNFPHFVQNPVNLLKIRTIYVNKSVNY